MGRPFHHILRTSKAVKQCLVVSLAVFLPGVSFAGEKVTESVIVASVEGEVSSLNMIDDFKVTMGPSSVGKKISSKTILSTGKTGKVSLLFSNGTLITVKPGSRFYLRKYKQLEAVVEDLPKPGELEEEPTKSELSAHLDFGELIVKAPKLKKGSSMNLTSPLGTAGIRGTMFQMMAVRNSVSGDISGGVNLISGDIDWTDTGGTMVTLLSGQSIQLVTSKLGEALGSKTGELVDLSATYGPALTEDGAMPPPTESLLASFSEGDDESEDEGNAEESDTGDPLLSSSGTASWEFIHNISTEIFFEIESNEVASSSFSFDSLQSAPAVEVPAPETQPLGPPPEVTGEKNGIANPDQYVGPAPEIALLGKNEEVWWRKISNNGFRMILEMRSASDPQTWLDLDPGIQATDYLGTDLSSNFVRVVDLVSSLYSVDQSNLDYPQFILHDPAKAPIEVPNTYNLTYIVRDYRGFRSSITRNIEIVVTEPTFDDLDENVPVIPMDDPDGLFESWINGIVIKDVRGGALAYIQDESTRNSLSEGYFYLDPMPEIRPGFTTPKQETTSFQVVAVDWRGVEVRSNPLNVTLKAMGPTITGPVNLTFELSSTLLKDLDPDITAADEFGSAITGESIVLSEISAGSYAGDSRLDSLDQLSEGETYTFTYQITDSRGVMVEETRNVSIQVTAPTLTVTNFQSSNNVYPTDVPHAEHTLEYKDPWGELLPWLQSASAIDLNNVDRANLITLEINGVADTDFSSAAPDLAAGSHKLVFEVIDPRYENGQTNSDWLDDLTTQLELDLTVVTTPANFDTLNESVPVIPMNDPAGLFEGWINSIIIKDVRGGDTLAYIQSEVERNSSSEGYFYLDPMPVLFAGFTRPEDTNTSFEVVAVDWRGVERRSEPIDVTVKATGPTITGSADLTLELSSKLLKDLDPDINASDEFGSSITGESIVLSKISPGSYTGDSRLDSLDQLSEGETYTFTYQISDSRGVMVEETRNVNIEVTAPTLMVSNFQSFNNVYPTDAPHAGNTLEYEDPWGELLPWLQRASALDLNNVNLTNLITLEVNGVADTDFSSTAPDLAEGSHELVFEVLDPRYEDGQTNSDWLNDLTTQLDLNLTVVSTPANFDSLNESVPEIPMNDPAGLFAGWINSIIIKDVRGGDALDYIQDESTRNDSSAGYFYLDPMPILAAGFTIPEDTNTSFEVVGVDWRGVERRSEPLNVTVKATGPTITGSTDLAFELSSMLLNDLDPDITAADEFGSAITGESIVLSEISPGSYTGDSRLDSLDHLSDGETYTFTYQITDSRGVMVEETRNVSIQVTAPTLTVTNFQSSNNVYPTDAPHTENTLEYKDPWGELLPWLQSASALDLNNVDLTNLITLKINGVSDTDFSSTAPDLAEGSHELVFEVIDPRYENGQTNSDWLDDLSLQQSIDLEVVKTAPVITIDYNSPRTGLSWNEDTSTLTYLVKPNATNGYETKTSDGDDGDDGEFAIGYDNGVDPLPVRKPFFQAIDFNGSDISNEVEVVGVVDGLYDVLTASPHHNISLSVNDHNTRDPVGGIGVISSISITLKIVDVLAPIMVLKEDPDDGQLGDTVETPFIFEGIATSNIDGSAEFPDPGYYIYDNYYTSEQIKSHLGIGTISNTTYSYPESPNKAADSLTKASFMDIPDQYVISSDVNLGAVGNYTISYQNITDPSGNQASESLVRYVSVFDERDPEVKIFGASTIYENLGNILTEQETYLDRGAYAYEDLSEGEGGLVNWQEEGWDWSVSVENWDFSSEEYSDWLFSVEDTIQNFKDNPDIVPTDLRLRLTYQLADKAGNLGTAQRVVNFTNSPNLIPTIMLLDPAINNPHEVEVDEIDEAPAVEATLDYSDYDEVLYSPNLRNNEYFLATTDTNETVSLPDWDKVNFHRSESGVEYYVEEEGGTLNFHDAQSDGWRKFIVHYSAANPSFPENVGILDLEVRIQDTTSPSFTIPSDVQDLEAGVSFTDGGISGLVDNYFNAVDLTTEVTITKTVGEIDQVVESPIGNEDVFLDLENEGFWEPGSYTITHTALDDFNNSTTQSYNISVVDTIAPHISLVTEDFLNNPGSVSLKAQYDTETLYLDVPNSAGVPTFMQNSYSVTEWSVDLWTAMSSPTGWDASTFDKVSPYVVYQQNKTFYLKQSEITNIVDVQNGEASVTNVYQDDFGRSFIWYSAFVLNNGTDFLRDPGVLIVNPSDYDVTVTSEIQSTYQTQGETNQLTSLKFSYKAIQNNAESSEISLDSNYSKTLIFLDEVAPTIFLTPEELGSGIGFTNSTDKFFLIEAGVDYLADSRGTGFKLWNGTPDTNPLDVLSDANNTLSVSAIDVVDGNLDDDINRTIIDVSTELKVQWGSNTIAGTDHLNKIYLVEYDVRDGDDLEDDSIRNWAETARRYFIVKDTTPPVISSAYNDTNVTISATSDVIDLSDIEEVKEHLISDLLDQITDIIDSNYVYADFNVTIGKSANPTADDFDGAEVYPEDRNDPGYYVTITVKDDSGNISDPINRELKIGDYEPPVITLNGDAIVHDFFRYGKNIGFDDNASAPKNEELLFADQASSPEFNSTGFGGGAHRLFLSQYNFTDPGAYAEDGNTSTNQGFFTTDDNFPDFDGDGVGEGHAILRKDDSFSLDADDMDIGIIYARSSLTDTTFEEVQAALEGLSTSDYSSQVPDVNTYSFTEENKTDDQEVLNVQLYLIEYRVKDGWGNLSEIKTRRVYFYESRQFGEFGFYATPLFDARDITDEFPDQNLTALSDNQKDYDGDGISDFWENALGTEYDDASSFPDSNGDGIPDLSSNQLFQNLSVTIPD